MLDEPVSPRKGRTLGIGLLVGLLVGSGGALLSDRRSGLVFSSEELSRYMPFPLLERLPCRGNERPMESWRAAIQLLADGPLADANSVALIPVGSIASADPRQFRGLLASIPSPAKGYAGQP